IAQSLVRLRRKRRSWSRRSSRRRRRSSSGFHWRTRSRWCWRRRRLQWWQCHLRELLLPIPHQHGRRFVGQVLDLRRTGGVIFLGLFVILGDLVLRGLEDAFCQPDRLLELRLQLLRDIVVVVR